MHCLMFSFMSLRCSKRDKKKGEQKIVKMHQTMPLQMKDGTFRNPWPTFEERTLLHVVKWKARAPFAAPKFPSAQQAAVLLPTTPMLDWDTIRVNMVLPSQKLMGCGCDLEKGMHATWLGHSTFLLNVGGWTILTDPVFCYRASPCQYVGPARMVPVPISLRNLPRIDVVTISHNHYDHLDSNAVEELIQLFHPIFVVPLKMGVWFSKIRGVDMDRVREVGWYSPVDVASLVSTLGTRFQKRERESSNSSSIPGIVSVSGDLDSKNHEKIMTNNKRCIEKSKVLRVTGVPAQHWSMRTGLDRYFELWCGFILETDKYRMYHAGDTGYCDVFKEIGSNFAPIDFAMIPIGAYSPRDFMRPQHVDPTEAVQIHVDIGAKKSVGMHWGTFILTDEPVDEPPKLLAAARQPKGVTAADFRTLMHGETMSICCRCSSTTATT